MFLGIDGYLFHGVRGAVGRVAHVAVLRKPRMLAVRQS